LIDKKPIILK